MGKFFFEEPGPRGSAGDFLLGKEMEVVVFIVFVFVAIVVVVVVVVAAAVIVVIVVIRTEQLRKLGN